MCKPFLEKQIMQSKGRNHSPSTNVLVGIIISIISCFTISPINSKNDGFSTELIHINSPLSPFFNPNLTRLGLLNDTEQIGSSTLIHDRNLYLIKISYGDPKVKYYQIVDTGSELSWIQCLPCIHCYQSKYEPFNPSKSKTFHYAKCSQNKTCPFDLTYVDGSHTRGAIARDTITVGFGSHKKKFSNFLFGCGHDNIGIYPHKSAGLLGFNLQERSFITQLHNEHRGKFSYCMAPIGSSRAGKISFGHNAIVSGSNVIKTPLILNSYFNIMLDAITIGTEKLMYYPNSYLHSNDSSQVIVQLQLTVDSGAGAIYLPESFYLQVEATVQKHIKAKSPVGPKGKFRLCYLSSLRDVSIPEIKLHFPGAVLELSPVNTFVASERYRCLAIRPTKGSPLLGNKAQTNFLVGYDLVENMISFKPTNCAKL